MAHITHLAKETRRIGVAVEVGKGKFNGRIKTEKQPRLVIGRPG